MIAITSRISTLFAAYPKLAKAWGFAAGNVGTAKSAVHMHPQPKLHLHM